MRIGLGIGGDGDLASLMDQFTRAETAGFDAAWVSNIFGFDAITLLALAGQGGEQDRTGHVRRPDLSASSRGAGATGADDFSRDERPFYAWDRHEP
jgi:hypothetical protein